MSWNEKNSYKIERGNIMNRENQKQIKDIWKGKKK